MQESFVINKSCCEEFFHDYHRNATDSRTPQAEKIPSNLSHSDKFNNRQTDSQLQGCAYEKVFVCSSFRAIQRFSPTANFIGPLTLITIFMEFIAALIMLVGKFLVLYNFSLFLHEFFSFELIFVRAFKLKSMISFRNLCIDSQETN